MHTCVGEWVVVELTLAVVTEVVAVMVMVAALVVMWGGWVDGSMNDGWVGRRMRE